MLRLKKKHIIKIIVLAIVLYFSGSIVYSIYNNTRLHEKTTFTAQETKTLWSRVGMDYVDLDISKAYFNRELFVISEGFDSVDAQIEYLKQFEGNENVHAAETFNIVTPTGHEDKKILEIFDIKCADKGYFTNCYTYEENGKYYLEFYVREARGRDLYEMFGFSKK
ncbi:hypothetical protein [Ruminococcus albus]|uniref:Uncharacterized protein n=1 Tax=Ruminococcus albus TaxID=1264 RepID=A0A1I1RFC8_RUMAL|nr:hypothetical protein [Ruminococcus albus]SFD32942.1 hypothetical protein SAMN02910406_03677 [Ruminococcus albus]